MKMIVNLTKATKRPWSMEGPHTVKDAPDSRAFLIVNERTVVAQIIHNPKEGDDTEICRTDAALIVTAVNQFDALNEVAEAAERVDPHSPDIRWERLQKALAELEALRKAKG